MMDLANPILMGPVQNQEHYMNGIVARRNNFAEPILAFLEAAYKDFAELTGRKYGLITEYKTVMPTRFLSRSVPRQKTSKLRGLLRETRGSSVGSIHINVIRPFPEAAVIAALKARRTSLFWSVPTKNVARQSTGKDIRTALSKRFKRKAVRRLRACPRSASMKSRRSSAALMDLARAIFAPSTLSARTNMPLPAVRAKTARQRRWRFIYGAGIDHPYAVVGDETPSLLPQGAVAVRFHSIGGWGAITTGKNLGAILGDLNDLLYARDGLKDDLGNPKEVIHVSANPKYALRRRRADQLLHVAAKDRIRVNCDLRHVTCLLCCDPKAFTHTNPLDGIKRAAAWCGVRCRRRARVGEPAAVGAQADHRQEDPRVHAARLRDCAQGDGPRRSATAHAGNAFLGAFFAVSPMLQSLASRRSSTAKLFTSST